MISIAIDLGAAFCSCSKPAFGLWRLMSFCISVFKSELLLTDLMHCCCEKLLRPTAFQSHFSFCGVLGGAFAHSTAKKKQS